MNHSRPEGALPGPRLIAWELTRRCNLRCRHCRAAACDAPYEGELTIEEILRTIDGIAARYKPILILTGGEPLLRPDLGEIVRHAKAAGLRPVLATCGALLTEERAHNLKAWGIERISISLDGPDAASHDAFRGVPGAFDAALAGLDAARRAGLPFQVNTTITKSNAGALPEILALAVAQGAVAFHPFLLVPTGRGESMKDELLEPEEYERILLEIVGLRASAPIPFKPTCAPHYYRVLRQQESAAGRTVTPDSHGLDALSRGCMGGTGFAFISHIGRVQICGFLELPAGDLRESGYSFPTIWEHSPLLKQLRDFSNYKGDCGICEYRRWCGGCRARAYALTGDFLAEEPSCRYIPRKRRTSAQPAEG